MQTKTILAYDLIKVYFENNFTEWWSQMHRDMLIENNDKELASILFEI